MKKRRKTPHRRIDSKMAAASSAPGVNLWELATGAFVVLATLFHGMGGDAVFGQAKAIVEGTALFEFSMGVPVVCALFGAEAKPSWQRYALLGLGLFAYLIGVVQWALELDAPVLIAQGAWTLAGRARRPKDAAWFDRWHCLSIAYETGCGWACFAVAMLFLMTFGRFFLQEASLHEAQPAFYAFLWGGFYLAMAFFQPRMQKMARDVRSKR